jgi:hypothetical protein
MGIEEDQIRFSRVTWAAVRRGEDSILKTLSRTSPGERRPVRWIEDRREHLLTINHSREHWRLTVAAAAATCWHRRRVRRRYGCLHPHARHVAELVGRAVPGP